MPRAISRRVGAEIIACLMKGPRTQKDIREMVACGERVLLDWMRELRMSGVVYRSQRHPDLYHLQALPFNQPDAAPKTKRA